MNIPANNDDIQFRRATSADEPFLWQMIFLAAHMSEDGESSIEAAKAHPYVGQFVRKWGRPGDIGVIAETADTNEPVGAAWIRRPQETDIILPHISAELPELAIAVRPEYAGRGLGKLLINQLIQEIGQAHPAIVLSVRENNPAQRLYLSTGFSIVGDVVNRIGLRSLVMQRNLA